MKQETTSNKLEQSDSSILLYVPTKNRTDRELLFKYLKLFQVHSIHFINFGYPVYNTEIVSPLQFSKILSKVDLFYNPIIRISLSLNNYSGEEFLIDVSIQNKKIIGCSLVPLIYRNTLLKCSFHDLKEALDIKIDWNNLLTRKRILLDNFQI